MSKDSALSMLQATVPVSGTNAAPTTSSTLGGSPGLQPAEGAGAPKQEPLDSTRFAHLAKKETELQRQREAFKKEQETFAAERQKALQFETKFKEIEQLKGKDLMQAMRVAGITEQDFYNYLASQEDTSTPEEKATKAAQAEIQKFRDEQTAAQLKAQEERNTEVLNNFRSNITKTITSNPDKYEYCNYNGPLAEELIYETVAAVLDADKVIISVQEAADMVEAYYEEQDREMAAKLKKRQAKQVEQQAPAPETPVKAPSKTISSRISATVASTTTQRKETRQEKRDRLIQTLGNLGKQ